ncbi:hypothetical protein BJ508DRAFT_304660 [Ascobolus immersus RN42]|uniref:Uncharacterized protein n=1 Tax=Ascobolus immersus RN42 TaxID=1160509 RepID=A0A3N4IH05_ASCIM|nr:hypothetical protein BJ508DRAFT_304660 [Ascobolus immersus RN42]
MARSDFFAAKGHSASPITKKRPQYKHFATSPAALTSIPRRREFCQSSSASDTSESDVESFVNSRVSSPVADIRPFAVRARSATPRPSTPISSKSSNRRKRVPETTSIVQQSRSGSGKDRVVKYKNFSESASDQTIETKYLEPVYDPVTGEPTGHKVLITKIVTMTMTTTVTVSKMLEEGEQGYSPASTASSAEQSSHQSKCECSCGHMRLHQDFHSQSQQGAKSI